MEALYTWMTEQGIDPAILPYLAGALAIVFLLIVVRVMRKPSVTDTQLNARTSTDEIAPKADVAEAARQVAEEAEQRASEEAERKAAEDETARQAAEAEAARQAREEAERKAAEEEAARQAAEAEAERQAREEAERKAAEEEAAHQAAEAEAERQAREEAGRKAAEEEAARQAAEAEAERQAREEAERKAAEEEAARQAAEAEAERQAREEAERKAAEEEAARKAAEAEAERQAREEAERKAAEEEAARKAAEEEAARKAAEESPEQKKAGFFSRIKTGLSRTKANLTEQLSDLFLGAKEIDDDLLEEIETTLLMADIGVEATTEIIERLTDRVERNQLKDAEALKQALKEELGDLLGGVEHPLNLPAKKPAVILMVGVNGVGKTTTIGKLAKRFQNEGKSVMLAAGDTFRAAAVEQLQVWGERNSVPVVAQHTGADSASVIFDALQSAQSREIDVLIADTAGRLQNKDNLMQELEKVVRVMKKLDPDAPHEVMLVLDAGTGQNAISQAKQFKESVGVTGITLTKLDGTAKGGIIFAIAKQFGLPIRFIGVGEQVDDLRPFEADEFVQALFED
ncbi:signal recognition particle-docking protein FtsY [Marinobacterium sp. AK62]|uniref:Signal recognition particle receptor FtsY n=1 Tax=Marinobacterium alkalitolerans TaxID=1542925 RepID=A0ABS3Z603_9GAMM|nr:signal recognition particle-docking protein FtsY [Marinobacterium alkalitolerans]MBP0047133.1 signal recognition particle-docking protein FtsY [Marinobacterium alkalitolerans]